MEDLRRKNLIRSMVLSALIFVLSIYFFWDFTEEKTLLLLAFVFCQLLETLLAAISLVLRLKKRTKNKFSFSYQLCGTFQLFLTMTDIILLVVNKSLTRYSLLIFFFINLLLGIGIFRDIYRTNRINKNHQHE